MEEGKKIGDYLAMVKEEQRDPVDDHVLHIDFKRISLTEKISVKVRTVSKGDAVGVKQDGGSLEHVLWELEVVCLPTQIPQSLEADVSHLKIGDSIYVRDFKLPEGVTTKQSPDTIVFTVVPPMKEELAQPTPATGAEPEVIKEKKEPVEGEKEKAPAAAAAEKKEEKKEEKK